VSNLETEQFSSIRAIRPVLASESLRHFVRCANKLIQDGGFELVDKPDAEVLVFAASALHSTLYVRRAPATTENNDRLRKIVNYIESPTHAYTKQVLARPGKHVKKIEKKENPLHGFLKEMQMLHVADGDQPLFRSNQIVDSTSPDSAERGYELSLLVEDGPVASLLMGQSTLLNDAAAKTVADDLLPRKDHNTNPLQIPFMRAPFSSQAMRDEFIDALSTELPVHGMGLRTIAYKHELVDV
jgi:hypothetical protein